MESRLLKGVPVRDAVLEELSAGMARAPRAPGLAVVLVGDDPASAVYVASKEKACEKIGFLHKTFRFPADVSEDTVIECVQRLNHDRAIDGILVQLPMPGHIDQERVLSLVDPRKDVDGFHPENLGRLVAGEPRFVACTPRGVQHLLRHYEIPVAGREVVIVGRSVIVGRPLAMLLSLKREDANATVTLCHSGTSDLASVTKRADIVVAAIGSPEALGRDHIAEGAVVVDVGINRISAPERKKGYRIVGDVAVEALDGWASAYTPVPGGVGPMTIAMLMKNTWDSMQFSEAAK